MVHILLLILKIIGLVLLILLALILILLLTVLFTPLRCTLKAGIDNSPESRTGNSPGISGPPGRNIQMQRNRSLIL